MGLSSIDGARLAAKHKMDATYHRKFKALRQWYSRRLTEIEFQSKQDTFNLGTDEAYRQLASYFPFLGARRIGDETKVIQVPKGEASIQIQYQPGGWEVIGMQHVCLVGKVSFRFGYGPLSDTLVVAVGENNDEKKHPRESANLGRTGCG